jgi:DNA-binding MarR family transcriptional regulator
LAITPEGEALLAETRNRRDAYLANRLQALTEKERNDLVKAIPLLERLVAG